MGDQMVQKKKRSGKMDAAPWVFRLHSLDYLS